MTRLVCGNCGAPKTSESSSGLCAACLLQTVLSDTTELDEVDDVTGLLPGTAFGPFIVRRPLGRGGMATVYEAVETQLDRAIALKVLPAEFMHDQTFLKRFGTEARLIARLEHPNIVPIYATGIEAGIPWMSMRLLAGSSLNQLLKTRRLESGEAMRVLRQVASALDYAHAQGVVHRDIKPANILLDGAGTAAVADFGLAQMMVSTNRLTKTGIVTGTPHYMAPEQALGKRVDHRCDIYSLGIVAYELFAGSLPFEGDSPVAILHQHVHEHLPIPPGSASAPLWMDPIRKAVAKDPAERWESAGRFIEALESSTSVGAPRADGRGQHWRRAALVAGTAVALIVIAWTIIQTPSPPPSPNSGPTASLAAPEGAKPEDVKAAPAIQKRDESAEVAKPPIARSSRGATTQTERSGPSSDRSTESPKNSPKNDPPQPQAVPTLPTVSQGPPPLGELSKAPPVGIPPPAADVWIDVREIQCPEPRYPPAAKAAGLEGTVVLRGLVGVDGKVTQIEVVESVNKAFNEAAQRAFRDCEFKPATRNGKPQSQRFTKPFVFKMGRES